MRFAWPVHMDSKHAREWLEATRRPGHCPPFDEGASPDKANNVLRGRCRRWFIGQLDHKAGEKSLLRALDEADPRYREGMSTKSAVVCGQWLVIRSGSREGSASRASATIEHCISASPTLI